MTRTFANTTALMSVVAAALFGGCQKPMGNAANGPFAPAGTLSPATSQPLIPFGPLNGATRVPPPPTGSTQANNGYASPAAMSAAPMGNPAYDSFAGSAGQPAPGQAFNGSNTFAPPMSQPISPPMSPSLSANSRSNLGGTPVIDLTAGMNPPPNMQIPYASQPVGSGIASYPPANSGWQNSAPQNNNWQSGVVQTGAMQPTPSISVPPSDLGSRLRPLDPNVAAAAMPMAGQSGYAQQGINHFVPQSSFQSPAAMTQAPPYVSQLPSGPSNGPSTDPVNRPVDSTGQNQANSLLWRNPAVAR